MAFSEFLFLFGIDLSSRRHDSSERIRQDQVMRRRSKMRSDAD
jgi:hypothetical protein